MLFGTREPWNNCCQQQSWPWRQTSFDSGLWSHSASWVVSTSPVKLPFKSVISLLFTDDWSRDYHEFAIHWRLSAQGSCPSALSRKLQSLSTDPWPTSVMLASHCSPWQGLPFAQLFGWFFPTVSQLSLGSVWILWSGSLHFAKLLVSLELLGFQVRKFNL